eukprot:362916-Chlamydomonas_euryale.AAC.2
MKQAKLAQQTWWPIMVRTTPLSHSFPEGKPFRTNGGVAPPPRGSSLSHFRAATAACCPHLEAQCVGLWGANVWREQATC